MRSLALALTLAALLWASPAQALDPCPDNGGTAFLVNSVVAAAVLANGYNNDQCDIIVSVPVAPTVASWDVFAKSFRILGVPIIHSLPISKIHITTDGDISLVGAAELRAREDVTLRCTIPGCTISAIGVGGVILASQSLDVFNIPGDPTSGLATKGTVSITALGPINLDLLSLFGGSRLELIGPKITVKTQQDATCPCGKSGGSGGGGQETRMTATSGDLDISGAQFTFLSHATFESKTGIVDARGTQIVTATNLQMLGFRAVLLNLAKWTVGGTVRVTTRTGCLLGENCVDAREADVTGFSGIVVSTAGNDGLIDLCGSIQDKITPGLPSLNGKASFPYPLSVILDVIQCALQGLPPATIK